jgi:hypothetical protein
VPIEKRPLFADLPWSVEFEFQAKGDPTGKDTAWWKVNRADFDDFERAGQTEARDFFISNHFC